MQPSGLLSIWGSDVRVDQAFKRAGFEIVSATKTDTHIIFDVRVPLQDQVPMRWKALMSELLPTAEKVAKGTPPKWEVDIAKRFFSRNGVVRYLWRVTMRGNLAVCQQALVAATLEALRTGNEVNEVRLVGQTSLAPDPANGRYKGAYKDDAMASAVVASAFTVGGV